MKVSLTVIFLYHGQLDRLQLQMKTWRKRGVAVLVLDDTDSAECRSIVEKHGGTYVSRHFASFADQRNAALEKVITEWSLFVDLDEEVSSRLWNEICFEIEKNESDVFIFRRVDVFHGQELKYGETAHVFLLRAARTKLGRGKWERAIHETWSIPQVRTKTLSTPLRHHAHETLRTFLDKLSFYAEKEKAEAPHYSTFVIVMYCLLYPLAKFAQNFIWRQGWRDGWRGTLYAFAMSYYSLSKRVMWYEAQHTV